MRCLYRSDYGPVDPNFDPLIGNGRLIKGFEAQAKTLSQAQNLGQLEAMERQLAHGRPIQWCEQGYSWTYASATNDVFYVALVLLAFPWLALRLLQGLRRSLLARRALAPARARQASS